MQPRRRPRPVCPFVELFGHLPGVPLFLVDDVGVVSLDHLADVLVGDLVAGDVEEVAGVAANGFVFACREHHDRVALAVRALTDERQRTADMDLGCRLGDVLDRAPKRRVVTSDALFCQPVHRARLTWAPVAPSRAVLA